MFLKFEFQNDRSRNFGAVGVEVRHFPLTMLIAYTTACCYRTSRDVYIVTAEMAVVDQWLRPVNCYVMYDMALRARNMIDKNKLIVKT